MGELGWPKYVGKLGWFKWGQLELACPTACTCLFKVRPGELSKILSHIWGKLNLTVFLFNVGLLTLIKIDYFNISNITMPLPPYYLKVILTNRMACVVAMMMYRGGILQVLFESFSKGPRGFPYVFIITGEVTTLEPICGSTFDDHGVLSFGETSRFLIVLLPLKWVCMPYLPQIFLIFLRRPYV